MRRNQRHNFREELDGCPKWISVDPLRINISPFLFSAKIPFWISISQKKEGNHWAGTTTSRQRETFKRGCSSGSRGPHTDLLSAATEAVETIDGSEICPHSLLERCLSTISVNYKKGSHRQQHGCTMGDPMSIRHTHPQASYRYTGATLVTLITTGLNNPVENKRSTG